MLWQFLALSARDDTSQWKLKQGIEKNLHHKLPQDFFLEKWCVQKKLTADTNHHYMKSTCDYVNAQDDFILLVLYNRPHCLYPNG